MGPRYQSSQPEIPLLLAGHGLAWQIIMAASVVVQPACAAAAGTTQRSVRQVLCEPGFHGSVDTGHVPNGWTGELTDAIERQLERFAPGFPDRVLARATANPPEPAARNANYVGGDIATGAVSGLQVVLRPKLSLFLYAIPHPAVFLCSSATPPGPGVHGMSGHNAAQAVWRRLRQT